MPLGMWTRACPTNYVLQWGLNPPCIFEERWHWDFPAHCQVPFQEALTLGFPCMLSTSNVIAWRQKQSGVTLNFPNETHWHVASEQNSLTTWLLLLVSLKYHRGQSSDAAPGVWYTDVCCHTSRMQWLRSVSLPTNVYMSVASWSCQQQPSIMCAKQTDDY